MTIQKPNWRIALFSVSFLALFLALGFWQLDRASEKRAMLVAATAQANGEGQEFTQGQTVANGNMIRASGKFLPEPIIYRDNSVLNGRVGYEVLQIFASDNGTNFLVNRGFVQAGLRREQLPETPIFNQAHQMIRGQAYLTELIEPTQNVIESSPMVVQVVKPETLSSRLNRPLFSHTIRLHESHPDALPRYWPVTTMTPERHQGYALTWFTMALAITIAFVFTLVRRAPNSLNKEPTS